MRLLTSAVLSACLLAAPLASAASQCAGPGDRHAFDVAGLKSELMVMALSCGEQSKYNQFISRYKSDLAMQETALTGYFKHAYGRSAQKAHDDYITQLANVQSDNGLKLGVVFCQQNAGMFEEVQALHGGSELPDYAHGQDIVQPVDFVTCGSGATSGRVLRASSRRSSRATHRAHKS